MNELTYLVFIFLPWCDVQKNELLDYRRKQARALACGESSNQFTDLSVTQKKLSFFYIGQFCKLKLADEKMGVWFMWLGIFFGYRS